MRPYKHPGNLCAYFPTSRCIPGNVGARNPGIPEYEPSSVEKEEEEEAIYLFRSLLAAAITNHHHHLGINEYEIWVGVSLSLRIEGGLVVVVRCVASCLSFIQI